MKIFYTDTAIKDLDRLRDFIAIKNPLAANNIAIRLKQAIERLIYFPQLGREVKKNSERSVRELVTGDYIIRYLLLEQEIHVLKVWHGREHRISIPNLCNPSKYVVQEPTI
jgi:toxin ParE1/3/4